jgi:hypothetical protein
MEPDTLLEWIGIPGLQMDAINALNMELLLADNVDTVFQRLPPRTFLPKICEIFLDPAADVDLLEAAMRAVTHYLDVHVDCARRVTSVEGAVAAICSRIEATNFRSAPESDLATQSVKVLKFLADREADAVHAAGALKACLSYIVTGGNNIYMDGRLSAMDVISKCCSRLDPTDATVPDCIERLSDLLGKKLDPRILQGALKCFIALTDRFSRRRADLAGLAAFGLPTQLVRLLKNAAAQDDATSGSNDTVTAQLVVQLLPSLCRNSADITKTLLAGELPAVVEGALLGDERLATSTLQLVELLLVILFDGREAADTHQRGGFGAPRTQASRGDEVGFSDHHLVELIRQKDASALCEAIESGVDPSHTDKMGQTLLNWASAFGTADMVEYLCDSGADVNAGKRSTSLHYAACYGRVRITQLLLEYGADHTLTADDGKTALDLAREKGGKSGSDGSHAEVIRVLESPDRWANPGEEDEAEEELAEDNDGFLSPGSAVTRTPSGNYTIGSSAVPAADDGTSAEAGGPAAAPDPAAEGTPAPADKTRAEGVPAPPPTPVVNEGPPPPPSPPSPPSPPVVEASEDPQTRIDRAPMHGCKPIGDAEGALLFVARLIPSLLRAFKAAMHDSLKAKLLETISSMIKYATPEMLATLFNGTGTVEEVEAAATAAVAAEAAAASSAAATEAAVSAAAAQFGDFGDLGTEDSDEEAELRAALAMSLSEEPPSTPPPVGEPASVPSAPTVMLVAPFDPELLIAPLPAILNASEITSGHNHALRIVEYLINKVPEAVKDHLHRVGVMSRVAALAKQGKVEIERRAALEAEVVESYKAAKAAAAAEEAQRLNALENVKAKKAVTAEAAVLEDAAADEIAAAAAAEAAAETETAPAAEMASDAPVLPTSASTSVSEGGGAATSAGEVAAASVEGGGAAVPAAQVLPAETLRVGTKIDAQFKKRTKFYPGTVKTVHADGTYDIDYDDGDKEEHVAKHFIRFQASGVMLAEPPPPHAPTAGVYRCLYEGGVALRTEPSQTAERTSGPPAPRYEEERASIGMVDGAEGVKYLHWHSGQYSAFHDPSDPSHKFFQYVRPLPPVGATPARSEFNRSTASLQQWEVETDDGWIPYDSHINDRITSAAMSGQSETSIGSGRIVRLIERQQIRTDTGKVRNVRAVPGIQVGMKLEAVDRVNPSLICVATIVDYQGTKSKPVKIHLDGWPRMYDYWTKNDSGDVMWQGYCSRHGIELQPPKGRAGAFSWASYLTETKATAVPKRMLPMSGPTTPSDIPRSKKADPTQTSLPGLQTAEKVRKLAFDLHKVHFAEGSSMRPIVLELKELGDALKGAAMQSSGAVEGSAPTPDAAAGGPAVRKRSTSAEAEARKVEMEGMLQRLCESLQTANISAFEFQSIGLADALLAFLSVATSAADLAKRNELKMRVHLFRTAFATKEDGTNPARDLVRQLVEVLQHVESLPVLVHDSPGSGHGLGVLTRQLRFKLRLHDDQQADNDMVDLSGRSFKMEPLASVRSLEKYLLQKVSKPWFLHDRQKLRFIEMVKSGSNPVFEHATDFDTNGIMRWIGTNGGANTEWCNPSKSSLVFVTVSSSNPSEDSGHEQLLPFGTVHDVLSREASARNCHTRDVAGSWMAIDTGVSVIPTAYTLRHARGYTRSALRSWTFEASEDRKKWTTLRKHDNDKSLEDHGSTHTWRLESPGNTAYRHIRITQTGKNAGGSHYLSLSGFELYGTVVGAADTVGPPLPPSRASPFSFGAPPPHRSSGDAPRDMPGLFFGEPGSGRGGGGRHAPSYPSFGGRGSGRGGGGGRSRGGAYFPPPPPPGAPSTASQGMFGASSVEVHPGGWGAAEDEEEELDLEDFDPESGHDDDGFAAHLRRMAAQDPERYRAAAAAYTSRPPPSSRYSGGPVPRESSWDDGKVIQREFSAMVPPFDPRPERQNGQVDPLTEMTIPPPGSQMHLLTELAVRGQECDDMPKMALFLVGTNGDGIETLQLLSPDMTIFRAVQQLAPPAGSTDHNRLSKIWEPTYTIVYRAVRPGDFPAPDYPWDVFFVEEKLGTAELQKSEVVQYLQRHGKKEWLKMWKLNGKCKSITKSRNCEQVAAAYRDFVHFFSVNSQTSTSGVLTTPASSPEKGVGGGPGSRYRTISMSGRSPPTGGGGGIGGGGAESSSDVTGHVRGEAVASLLQMLQASKIPASGPFTVVDKKQMARMVKAAVADDRSGELVLFLRSAGWNGTGFASDDEWLALQGKARLAAGNFFEEDDEMDDEVAKNDPTDLILKLIRTVYEVAQVNKKSDDANARATESNESSESSGGGSGMFDVDSVDFISQKLNSKLRQQMQDPLVLATRALPSWCEELTASCPVLFPFETRQLFFCCTAFGVSRTIHWIQKERDAADQARNGGSSVSRNASDGRPDTNRSVGRLTSERVFVPRGDQLLDWAVNVMRVHASRKSILEVQFQGEAGYGLGPTLAFYNMVAEQVQRKDLAMWVCDDEVQAAEAVEASGAGADEGTGSAGGTDDVAAAGEQPGGSDAKPAGYYVRQPNGLFPAPLPRTAKKFKEVVEHFRFLGTFVAKSLQDERLVDLPLSVAMFKLMCGHTLELPDLLEIVPEKGKFLFELQNLTLQKREIETDPDKSVKEKQALIDALLVGKAPQQCRVEDLCLSFVYAPTSHIYGFPEVAVEGLCERVHELKPGGAEIELTLANAEEYVQLSVDFLLQSGIRTQLEAFKSGFQEVFPIEKLAIFTPLEVQQILCGEQCPEWDMEALYNFTQPQQGYTRESTGYVQFVQSLDGFNVEERKRFLNFATGCPSLPPGGLTNLYPRLTVVPKESGSSPDHTYPSVNTCVHYFKMPLYSCQEVARQRILEATHNTGFHLS